jgi:hypothetical protein
LPGAVRDEKMSLFIRSEGVEDSKGNVNFFGVVWAKGL